METIFISACLLWFGFGIVLNLIQIGTGKGVGAAFTAIVILGALEAFGVLALLL